MNIYTRSKKKKKEREVQRVEQLTYDEFKRNQTGKSDATFVKVGNFSSEDHVFIGSDGEYEFEESGVVFGGGNRDDGKNEERVGQSTIGVEAIFRKMSIDADEDSRKRARSREDSLRGEKKKLCGAMYVLSLQVSLTHTRIILNLEHQTLTLRTQERVE